MVHASVVGIDGHDSGSQGQVLVEGSPFGSGGSSCSCVDGVTLRNAMLDLLFKTQDLMGREITNFCSLKAVEVGSS